MADKKLEKQLEEQRETMAELGRKQSAATGQKYDEIDQVPVSDVSLEQDAALKEASEQSLAGLDLDDDKKKDDD